MCSIPTRLNFGTMTPMNKLTAPGKVYVDKSLIKGAGRGVFAKLEIKDNEVIEKCPTINLSKYDAENLSESILVTYLFYFGRSKDKAAVALGFGSIYNHSYKPNATYRLTPKEQIIEFIAIRDIKPNEEITFNYYNSRDLLKRDPLWFETKK